MNRLMKFVVLSMIISPIIGSVISVSADTSKILFGMPCDVTRISVSGNPEKTVFVPGQYVQELSGLTKKGYTRIDLIKTFTNGDSSIKILLGEKCGHNVLRVNQEESINDIGVDHIEKQGNKLLMYGSKDGYATMISCDLGLLTGNGYIPFDLVKQNVSTTSGETSNTNIKYPENISTQPDTGKLVIENKIFHPQDKFVLLRKPVSELIKIFGGQWNRDRKELANILNITNYQGTKQQNLKIKNYLLSHIIVEVPSIETHELVLSSQDYKLAQKAVVSSLAKLRNYTWKYDRWGLFQEINGNISVYQGYKTQNLEIRKFLLTKIKK